MNEYFCLQPYHIGEKLLTCLFNRVSKIIEKRFEIKNFVEAIPEQSFTFNNSQIQIDDQHKIDIALRDENNNFYPVELKLGPHNITKENKTKVINLFIRYFKDKCYINEKSILNGNMCCLLSNQWKISDKIPEWSICKPNDVFSKWFLIVRDNSVKSILQKSKSKYLKKGLDNNCTVLSLEEIIKGHETEFMNCIRECTVLSNIDDYLIKWGLFSSSK